MELEELQYCEKIRQWLVDRYGSGADAIWQKIVQTYTSWLTEAPDYGGNKNGHANAIYGGMLVFALYTALPDQPPISELEGFSISCPCSATVISSAYQRSMGH